MRFIVNTSNSKQNDIKWIKAWYKTEGAWMGASD